MTPDQQRIRELEKKLRRIEEENQIKYEHIHAGSDKLVM